MSTVAATRPASKRGRWQRLDGFQKLALITTAATYLLIMVGGFVRAAGAGLGCPDWPKCFGYWWPPSTADKIAAKGFDAALFNPTLMWIEYVNRLVGVAVGFLIIATMVAAIRRYRHVPRVLYPTIAAFILVLFEGWLGKVVVEYELQGWLVSVHLIMALVIVSLLLYASVCAFFPAGAPLNFIPSERRKIARYTQLVIGLGLVQLTLGALVRGHIDDEVSRIPDLPRSEWVANVGLVDQLHRIGALLLTAAVLGLAVYVLRQPTVSRWLRRSAWSMSTVVLLQVAAGLGLAYGALPPPLQTIHIILGTLLIGVLTAQVLLAFRLPVDTGVSEHSPLQSLPVR